MDERQGRAGVVIVQDWVDHAFPFVLFGAVALSFILALAFLIAEGRSPSTGVGRGGLDVSDRVTPEPTTDPEVEAEAAERTRREQLTEIRQLLGAISDLRVARGRPAIDVEAEVRRLAGCAELDPRELAQLPLFPLATRSPDMSPAPAKRAA